jgi:hypothetical protein
VRRADKLTTFMCRLSWNLGASTSWNPVGLSRPVMGLLYLFFLSQDFPPMNFSCLRHQYSLHTTLHAPGARPCLSFAPSLPYSALNCRIHWTFLLLSSAATEQTFLSQRFRHYFFLAFSVIFNVHLASKPFMPEIRCIFCNLFRNFFVAYMFYFLSENFGP